MSIFSSLFLTFFFPFFSSALAAILVKYFIPTVEAQSKLSMLKQRMGSTKRRKVVLVNRDKPDKGLPGTVLGKSGDQKIVMRDSDVRVGDVLKFRVGKDGDVDNIRRLLSGFASLLVRQIRGVGPDLQSTTVDETMGYFILFIYLFIFWKCSFISRSVRIYSKLL